MDFRKRTAVDASTADGVVFAGIRYFGSLVRHLVALLGLAQLEAKEAAFLYIRVLVFIVLGLIFAVFGYIFFILFIAFLCGVIFGVAWYWITLGFCAAHFFLALICAWRVREGIQTPVFTITGAEVKRDIEQLTAETRSDV